MNKYVYFGFLALLGCTGTLSTLHPLPARAAEPPQIILSEINWSGSETSTADEWLELANTGVSDVDLSNWYLSGIGSSGGLITLPPGSIIKASGTFLMANYPFGDAKTTLNTLPDYVTTAISIPNSSLAVHLFMSDGTEIDNYVDSGTPDYGSTSPITSIERDLADLSWHAANTNANLLDATEYGTPGVAVWPTPSDGVMTADGSESTGASTPTAVDTETLIADPTPNSTVDVSPTPIAITETDIPTIIADPLIPITDTIANALPVGDVGLATPSPYTELSADPPADSSVDTTPALLENGSTGTSTPTADVETVVADPTPNATVNASPIPIAIAETDVAVPITDATVDASSGDTGLAAPSPYTELSADPAPVPFVDSPIAPEPSPDLSVDTTIIPLKNGLTTLSETTVDETGSIPSDGALTPTEGDALIPPPDMEGTGEVITPADPIAMTDTIAPVPLPDSSADTTSIPPENGSTPSDGVSTPTAGDTLIPPPDMAGTGEVITPPSSPTGSLIINELLPSPSNGDEWLEIYNPGTSTIRLVDWYLKDASGKVTELTDTPLPAHGFLVINNPNGNLNNSGDTVTLFDPSNNVIDTVTYGTTAIPAPKKDEALAKDATGAWGVTTGTPGGTNVFAAPVTTTTATTVLTPTLSEALPAGRQGEGATPTTAATTAETINAPLTDLYVTTSNNAPAAVGTAQAPQAQVAKTNHVSAKPAKTTVRVESVTKTKASVSKKSTAKKTASKKVKSVIAARAVSITEITGLDTGTLVTVEGKVVVSPNTFGKQIAFLNGLELYFNKALWPDLPIGTTIRVTGTIAENGGNKRLKIAKGADIEIVGLGDGSTGASTSTAEMITSITDQLHGSLISFAGTLADKKGSTLTVLLANGEAVPVALPKGVPLSAKVLTAGASVSVTGILKRKDGAYTVALRGTDDISLLTSPLPSPEPVLNGGEGQGEGEAHGTGMIVATKSDMPIVGGGLLTTTLGALSYWYAKSKGLSLLTLIKT